MKIPLMFIKIESCVRFKPMLVLSEKLRNLFSNLKYSLVEADIPVKSEEYIAASIINSLLYFLVFFIILVLVSLKKYPLEKAVSISLSSALLIFLLIFFLLIKYPDILAGKKGEKIEKHLIFALKDLLLQVNSGVSLYNGLVNLSKSDYGEVSVEIEKAVRMINSGTAMDKALEKIAVESKSDFLRKTVWQLINTLKSGASLQGTLRTTIDDLTIEQRNKIRSYGYELNFFSLIYMLFAVAIPAMGSTLLVILSSFMGAGLTKSSFIMFLIICFIVQIVIIGFIKSRRPIVNI